MKRKISLNMILFLALLIPYFGWGAPRPAAALPEMPGITPIMVDVDCSNLNTMVFNYIIPPITIEELDREYEGETLKRVTAGNAGSFQNTGAPILPFIPAFIILPEGRTIDNINVTLSGEVIDPGSHFIEFGGPVVSLSTPPEEIPPEAPNDDIYNSNNPYPQESYQFGGIQRKRGVSIAVINIYPVIYLPQSGTVKYYTSISLEVNTKTESFNSPPELVCRPDRNLFENVGVENIDVIGAYRQGTSLATPGGICNPAQSFQYVIITNQAIMNATSPEPTIRQFSDHKKSLGLTAEIVTVDGSGGIYNNYPGVDRQEKIRNFIKDAYNNWETDFVLLCGDVNVIPDRKLYSWVQAGISGFVPGDLYYQCLDGNYNADGDNIFGEWDMLNPDGIDAEAEVFIGRMAAENCAEVSNIVKKTQYYELNPNSDFYTSALFISETLIDIGDGKFYMDEIKNGKLNNTYGFAQCPSPGFTFGDMHDIPPTTYTATDYRNAINDNKYSIINHAAHGLVTEVMKFPINDANFINDAYPFLYSQACLAGAFDQNCMAEFFTTQSPKGMWGAVMNSREGLGNRQSKDGPSQNYHRQFWHAYFNKKIFNVGAMNTFSHTANIPLASSGANRVEFQWSMYTTNLLGDPHTMIIGYPEEFVIKFFAYSVDDGPSGNGIINPNEDVTLNVGLVNSGNKNAVGTVMATLSTSDSYIEVKPDGNSATFTSFPCGGIKKFGMFKLNIKSPTTLPYTAVLNLAIQDGASNTCNTSFTIVVNTVYSISGKVTTMADVAIPNAKVEYWTNSSNGQVITDASGNYLFYGIKDMEYSIRASASGGYIVSDVIIKTLTSNITNVDFKLGSGNLSASPSQLNVTISDPVNNPTAQRQLTVSNSGTAPIPVSVTCSQAPNNSIFFDGFENGISEKWTLFEDNTVKYEINVSNENYFNGSYSLKVKSNAPPPDKYSFEWPNRNGLSLIFPEGHQANVVSFAIFVEKTRPYFLSLALGDEGKSPITFSYDSRQGTFWAGGFYCSSWNNSTTKYDNYYLGDFTIGNWNVIKFIINWQTHTYDVYINNILKGSNLIVEEKFSSIKEVYLWQTQGTEVFYDDIYISTNSGMTVSPANPTVPAGGNVALTVDFNATGIVCGSHNGQITVKPSVTGNVNEIAIPYTLSIGEYFNLAAKPASIDFSNSAISRKTIFHKRKLIADLTDGVYSLFDLDNDNDVDLIDSKGNTITAVINDNIAFTKKLVISPHKATSRVPIDLNQNNRLDIISASATEICWFEELTQGQMDFAEVSKVTSERGASGVYDRLINNDDDFIDVVAITGTELYWYKNIDNLGIFEANLINNSVKENSPVAFVLMDSDNNLDIVALTDDGICWLKNNNGLTFTKNLIYTFPAARAIVDILAVDLDGDGDIDVITGGNECNWYQNQGDNTTFIEKPIQEAVIGMTYLHTADIDKDGDIDLLLCTDNGNYTGKSVWLENKGIQAGNIIFTEHVLARTSESPLGSNDPNGAFYRISTYDLNGDGNEDIFLNNSKSLSYLEKEFDNSQCMLNLINQGNNRLTISSIDMSNPAFTYDADLPMGIEPFSSVAISVIFTPETDDQVEIGTMKLNYNQSKQLTVNLTGKGVLPYDLYIENQTMTFKRVFGAHHNIYTGPDFMVKNTADVRLKAGNEINLLNGSKTEYGAKLNVTIDRKLLNP